MDQINLFPADVNPLLLIGFCHFISYGIHDNRRMIIVPFHHSASVFFPALFEITSIVIWILAVIPHIEGLIHNIHAVLIAGT